MRIENTDAISRVTGRYHVDMRNPQSTAAESEAALTVLKQKEVLNFDGSLYRTQRIFAKAPDGTKVWLNRLLRSTCQDICTVVFGIATQK